MSDILTKQNVSVEVEDEVVILNIGIARAKFHYRTALRIGQHLRLNAKTSQRLIKDAEHWSKHGIGSQENLTVKLIHTSLLSALKYIIRPKALTPTTQRKKVWVENIGTELVRLHLGANTHVDMHYTTAIQISDMLRLKGKEAKKNTGDGFKELSAIGSLHDAAKVN